MANRSILPTVRTVSALQNFSDWLREKLKETKTSETVLAREIGLERKTIVAIVNRQRYPKLDVLAAIFAYFGEDRISIEINPRRYDNGEAKA